MPTFLDHGRRPRMKHMNTLSPLIHQVTRCQFDYDSRWTSQQLWRVDANDNAGLAPQERLSRKERHEIMKRSKERSTVTAKVDSNNMQWEEVVMLTKGPLMSFIRPLETNS